MNPEKKVRKLEHRRLTRRRTRKVKELNYVEYVMNLLGVERDTAVSLLVRLPNGDADAFMQSLLYKLNNNPFTVVELAQLDVLQKFLASLIKS